MLFLKKGKFSNQKVGTCPHSDNNVFRSRFVPLQPPHHLLDHTPDNRLPSLPHSCLWQALPSRWGPTIPPPLAWFLMESPTVWLTLLLFPQGQNHRNPRALILISAFLLHRTIIYPLKLLLKAQNRKSKHEPQTSQKIAGGFPVRVALMAFGFNLLNAYLQARWVSEYADFESDQWFWWRWAALFGGGMATNIWSDNLSTGLKSGAGYKVPKGGLFECVGCPNYFGQILDWLGWALMTWSWAGFGFFVMHVEQFDSQG